MSFRFLTQRLFRHGRLLVQQYCFKRDIHQAKILENRPGKNVAESLKRAQDLAQQQLRNQSIFRFGTQARRLFVDNILNRVTNPCSAELRSQATRKFFNGDSTPFFALVGVSLATGTGILTRDDELEGVCYEIREAVSRFQRNWAEKELNDNFNDDLSLNDLSIGPPIAKGCSAVVYAAKFKEAPPPEIDVVVPDMASSPVATSPTQNVTMSPVQNISRFIHNFGNSVDNLFEYNFDTLSRDTQQLRRSSMAQPTREVRFDSRVSRFSPYGSTENISASALSDEEESDTVNVDGDILNFPLALKIMFNYDIESNAMAILRAMHKETVPARRRNIEVTDWEKNFINETVYLPPHPNVVAIYGVFCDRVPKLRHASKLFPMALPPRLNPQGYGRNMSLFLLMKRYELSLKDFLISFRDVDLRDRILLFAQLLEAVTHLNRHGVAHRDLKTDNILIEINQDGTEAPILVLSDFGCCIADKNHGLQIPYTSMEIDKGGNTALMAPEIIMKQPGVLSRLDYSKADLWACGTIAYELFGQTNPFYHIDGGKMGLKSHSYREEQLPKMKSDVPILIRKLIDNILQKNPRKRVLTEIAANIVQLYLWAPSRWLYEKKMPSSNEILQWLLCLTTKTLCEARITTTTTDLNVEKSGRRSHTEYLLISSFLARAQLNQIRSAFKWIQNVIIDHHEEEDEEEESMIATN